MTTYGINDNRKLTQDGSAADGIKPRIYFRERPLIELAAESIHAGDDLRLAVDVDKDFLATAPMAVATSTGAEGSVVFELNCATSRFEEVINGRACLVCAYIQLTRWSGGNCEVLVDDRCYVGSLVSVTGDDVEILPKPVTIPVPDVADAGKVIGVDGNGNYALQEGGGGGGGSVEQATDAEIDARESTSHAITPNNLDYAGRSVVPNVTTIPAATTAYALLDATATTNNHSWQYTHAPTAASTYTLPAVTDTSVAHYIKLTIDFTSVQTYAFEDANGTALAPLFTPTISAGDVYEFDCEYSAAKSTWLIWPHKQGAVSDDYVMQSEVGAANGVAGLDRDGLIPSGQLPIAYVSGRVSAVGGVCVDNRYGNWGYNGIYTDALGRLYIGVSRSTEIDNRVPNSSPSMAAGHNGYLTPAILNYAVTAALTDAHKIQLTDAQKASAQDTLGIATPLIGTTAPTTSTAGSVGQLYVDTATSKTYHCTAVNVDDADPENVVTTYTWTDDVNAMGGSFGSNAVLFNGITINPSAANHLSWNIANDTVLITSSSTSIGNADMTLTAKPSGVFKVITLGATMLLTPAGWALPVTVIPDATSAFSLSSGVFQHSPSSASTYTMPPDTEYILLGGVIFRRYPSSDGVGYYAWNHVGSIRYTASANPNMGDYAYTNTALTQGKTSLTVDNRTRECILTVRFSASVLTYAFEDSAGNAITPLPLAGTIADGSVVCFRCTWEALLNQWVIMPVMLGTYTA